MKVAMMQAKRVRNRAPAVGAMVMAPSVTPTVVAMVIGMVFAMVVTPTVVAMVIGMVVAMVVPSVTSQQPAGGDWVVAQLSGSW